MSETQTYVVMVVRRSEWSVTVDAHSDEEAKAEALRLAFDCDHPTVSVETIASVRRSWPADEPEEMTIEQTPEREIRRGWFHRLYRPRYQTVGQGIGSYRREIDNCVGITPDTIEEGETPAEVFSLLLNTDDVSDGNLYYGYGVRVPGEDLWLVIEDSKEKAIKAFAREMTHKRVEAQAAEVRAREAQRLASLEERMFDAVKRMQANDFELIKTHGGRWTTKGYVLPNYKLQDGAWFTTIDVVESMLARSYAYVFDSYAASGAPRVIALTTAGTNFKF